MERLEWIQKRLQYIQKQEFQLSLMQAKVGMPKWFSYIEIVKEMHPIWEKTSQRNSANMERQKIRSNRC